MTEQNTRGDLIRSLCPECLRTIPGLVTDTSSGVVMEKSCPDHGCFRTTICSDRDTYDRIRREPRKITKPLHYGTEPELGCPDDCGLCPSHEQHTCLAILDITSRCDLECPICLTSTSPQGRDLDISVIGSALEKLIRMEGRPTPLQLSGGEPTLHDDLEGVIRSAASLGFSKIELDTNGIALGRDVSLTERLREAGLSQVYLQMDGLDPEISRFIRGRDLVEDKMKAIQNCKKSGLQVALAVTVVPGINDNALWTMIRFGMEQGLTGINFQAVVQSGRYPKSLSLNPERLTLGHFMQKVEEQSNGKLLGSDLIPIPCPDPRCGALAYALVWKGDLIPLTRQVHRNELLDVVADMSDWETVISKLDWESRPGCGPSSCCSDLPVTMDRLFFGSDHLFSVGYHGMMDAHSFDLDRAKRCCVHALTAEGRLIPFCLYNIKYR
ncbi:radical SAM protein [Thermodesulfobacteriota bacterium]